MKYFIVKEACVWQLQTCTWKVDCWNQRVSPYVELWVSHFFQKWLAKGIFHFSVKEKTKYCREMLDVPLGNVHLISLYEYPFQPFFSTCPRPWAAKPSFMGIIVSWAFLLIIYNYWHEIAFFFSVQHPQESEIYLKAMSVAQKTPQPIVLKLLTAVDICSFSLSLDICSLVPWGQSMDVGGKTLVTKTMCAAQTRSVYPVLMVEYTQVTQLHQNL